jgi:hypothetical protein
MTFDYLTSVWSFFLFVLIVLPAGYLVFSLTNRSKDSKRIDIGVILTCGVVVWLLLSFSFAAIGQLRNMFLPAVLVEWIVFSFYLLRKLKGHFYADLKSRLNLHLLKETLFDLSLPIALLLFSLFYFAYFAWQMQWAPPGDSVVHSTIIGLITKTGHLVTPQVQAANMGFILHEFTFGYPPGFHLIGAIMTFSTGLFPGITTVLTAAFISAIMPLLVFSIVFKLTKSKVFSLFAFILTFLLLDGQFSYWPTHDLLTSNLSNGTYMTQAGNLLLLFLIYLFVADDFSFSLYWATLISLVLTYTGYLSYALIWTLAFVALNLWHFRSHGFSNLFKNFFSNKLKLGSLLGFVAISLVPLLLPNEVSYIFRTMYNSSFVYRIFGDWLPVAFKFPYLLVVVCCILSVFALIALKTNTKLVVIYVSTLVLVLFSLNESIYSNLLYTTYPERFFPVFLTLGYCVLSVFLAKAVNFSKIRFTFNFKKSRIYVAVFKKKFRIVVTACLLIVTVLLVFQPYTNHVASTWGTPQESDYDVLSWISTNIPEHELILNDRTFSSLYLTSFSAKFVVNTFPMPFSALNRANELDKIFDDPGNYEQAHKLFSKYNVSYVFVSSEGSYKDWLGDTWHFKPLSAEHYLMLFDLNPYLTRVYSKGASGIFRVSSAPSNPKSVVTYPLLSEYWVCSNGTASVIIKGSNASIMVNSEDSYGGFSFMLPAPLGSSSAVVHLQASSTSVNKQPSINGYVHYVDGNSSYFQTNLDSGSFTSTGYVSIIDFVPSKQVDTVEVFVGLLWSGYIGSLEIHDVTLTWQVS